MHKLSYVIGLLQEAMQKHGDIAFSVEGSGPLDDLDRDGCLMLHEITRLVHYPDAEGDCLVVEMRKAGYASKPN
jgi:hypothetical protein